MTLGCDDQAVWGECQGSGKNPYQTQINRSEPAFKCSCASRKFPCKHGLGLLLLFANQANQFKQTLPPTWVSDWLTSRTKRAEQKIEKNAGQAEEIADPAAQAKRVASREAKVAAGFRELRDGKTADGKTKLKSPSGTLSPAEAISVMNSGLALAAHFGDGVMRANDVASGLVSAVVKDPMQDRVVWLEYLETVVKERDGWKDLYRACREVV